MSEKLKQSGTKTGIAITLNGGKKVMNSATIPIEWWPSKEVREKGPKYILFFEQDSKEKDYYRSADCGRRYACKVSDVFKYLEIFSSGYHRVMVIAIAGKEEDAQKVVKSHLNKECRDYYSVSLNWNAAKNNASGMCDHCFTFSTMEEFEVPEDLFAKKPEGRVGKLIWRWVNFWFESEPKNECEYGKRKVFAFTAQPFLALIVYGIFGTIYSAYILLASLATLFVGYRPRPIFEEMWKAFTLTRHNEWDVSEWDVRRYHQYQAPLGGNTYRLWSTGELREDAKYMPVITPLLVTLIGGAGVGLYYIIKTLLPLMLSLDVCLGVIGTLVFAVFVLYIIISYIERTAPERKKMRQQKEKERQQAFEEEKRKWLENFDLSKKTDEVYLDRLPVPPTFSGKVVQKFRVSYWTLKAKACKPYSR